MTEVLILKSIARVLGILDLASGDAVGLHLPFRVEATAVESEGNSEYCKATIGCHNVTFIKCSDGLGMIPNNSWVVHQVEEYLNVCS